MRGLSTSTASCPRRCRRLRPPPESQFFCGPEPPEIPRVPAVRHAPAQWRGLVTKPVPCSLHASLMEERLRARSPASDGDDHDPRRGDGQGDARPPHDADDAREATAGRTRVDQPLIRPASVPPSQHPRADGTGRQRLRPPGRRLRPPLASARPGHPPARAWTRSHNPLPGRSAPARGRPIPITTIRIAPPRIASDPPRPRPALPQRRRKPDDGVSC